MHILQRYARNAWPFVESLILTEHYSAYLHFLQQSELSAVAWSIKIIQEISNIQHNQS